MGLSSALGQMHATDGFEANAAVEFLQRLDKQLPELRRELLTEATSPSLEKRSTRAKRLDARAGRIRQLAAQAAAFGHPIVAEELGVCEAVLGGGGVLGTFDEADAAQLDESLQRVSAYIIAEYERERTPTSGPVRPREEYGMRSSELPPPAGPTKAELEAGWALQVPPTVLVVAAQTLAHSLEAAAQPTAAESEGEELPTEARLDVECVEEAARAPEMARALAPDVLIVDVDLAGGRQLVETLVDGPLTAAIPIVALGDWENVEQAAPYIELGVTRTLAKPASPGALRRVCLEVAANPASPTFQAIGKTTLDDLGQRLAEELRHGLCDSTDDKSRSMSINVGQGTEVHTALWGAIGRIRELVAAKSEGRVRFVPTGPESALPTASWLAGGNLRVVGERSSTMHEVRRAAPEHSLVGRSVLIAEDDLSVNWFLGGVLRQAGATVHEARNGARALEHAYRHVPDLVVSDVLLPELDGYSLCRALKRDVLLRDVPVILLAWKDDLLQRVRELGAGADGYLRKEASSSTIVRRFSEVLRPRSEVATRIEMGGPVRGRLDGLTAYSLLQLVCRFRQNARLSVRDAMFLYEIEVREGRPVSATRTAADGRCSRGADVIAALLGVGLGRFGLADVTTAAADDLEGTLDEQLVTPVARARAAQGLLSGPALLEIDQVTIDDEHLASQSSATPLSARRLLQALAAGHRPSQLIEDGDAPSAMVERVLADAVLYGAVRSVWIDEIDVLADAADRERWMLSGKADAETVQSSLSVLMRAAGSVPTGVSDSPTGDGLKTSATAAVSLESSSGDDPSDGAVVPDEVAADPLIEATITVGDPHCADHRAGEAGNATPILASGMAVAPEIRVAKHVAPPEPFGDARPSAGEALQQPAAAEPTAAVQPSVEPNPPAAPPLAAAPPAPAPPAAPAPAPATVAAAPSAPSLPAAAEAAVPVASRWAEFPDREADPESATAPRVPRPSAYATDSRYRRRRRPRNRFLWPIVFGVIGISLAVGARWMRENRTEQTPALPPPAQQQLTEPAAQSPSPGATSAVATEGGAATPSPAELPQELALTKDDEVGAGEGMLEVVAGKSDKIYVNGKLVGKGPVQKITLKAVPDPYEVRVKMRGEERVRYAVVKEGKRIKLRVAPPWKR